MISLYPIPHQSVNRKGASFKTSLIHLVIELYSSVLNKLSYYMQLCTEMAYELPKHFNNSIKYTYNFLLSNYPLFKQFHISKKYLSDKLNLQARQIERYFLKLETNEYLRRVYDTIELEHRKNGNSLFLILTPPVKLTFRAKFEELYQPIISRGTSITASFTNVHSTTSDDYYSDREFRYFLCNEQQDGYIDLLKNLKPDDPVYFESEIKLNKQGKQFLDKIINIREV